MRRIPLRARNGSVRAYALIDDEDYGRVSAYRWSLHRAGYAYRTPSPRGCLFLHRFLMGLVPGDGREVDHENGDRLDCRRENLRLATRALNAQNVTKRAGTSSRFRGVAWYAPRACWQAYVTVGGRMRKLGYRADEIEAAKLAQAARDELMPFARPDPELAAALA